MPVQKLTLTVTVLCEADTLEEAVNLYSSLELSDVEARLNDEDIGQVHVAGAETVPPENIQEELLALGNDGEFYAYLQEETAA